MLDRWGFGLRNKTYIQLSHIKNVNMEPYYQQMRQLVTDKKILVLNFHSAIWTERYLTLWVFENYEKLGFQNVTEQHTDEYDVLKKELRFKGYPDFIVEENGKILRLELECFPYGYLHEPNYCDIVLCYELNTTPPPEPKRWIGLKELLGYEEVICDGEILEYMMQKFPDFKTEIEQRM